MTWSKIFSNDIIKRYKLQFDENINFREDELFTFQYCKYVNSIKTLSTVTYNYRNTANSLMRRNYINPQMLFYVINKIYDAALELPLSVKFRIIVENYYTNSLSSCAWLAYTQGHLQPRKFRLEMINAIVERNKLCPTKSSLHCAPFNPIFSDWYHLLRFLLKKSILSICD